MKKASVLYCGVLCLLLATFPLTLRAQFTGSGIVVLRVGNGSSQLNTTSFSLFLDQFDKTTANQSSPNYTVPLPTSGTSRIALAGTTSNAPEGQITISPDYRYIVLAGYDTVAGLATVSSKSATQVARKIDTINYTGTTGLVDTTMFYMTSSPTNCAITNGNGDFWLGGNNSSNSIVYMGNNGPRSRLSQLFFPRHMKIIGGNLYFSNNFNNPGIYVYNGTPTTIQSSPTSSPLVGDVFLTTNAPIAFDFNSTIDVCYVTDNNTTAGRGGVMKYTKSGSTWTKQWCIAFAGRLNDSGAVGMVVDWSGTNPVLYATTSANDTGTGNRIVRITDTVTLSGGARVVDPAYYTVLATAPVHEVFRGIVFSPFLNVAPTFVNSSPQTINVVTNSSNNNLKSYLHVSDTNSNSQTETWTQQVAPLHGTLSISSATATSGSSNITPGGTITYTPTASYSGNDTFTIKVSDGMASSSMVFYVSISSTNTAPTFVSSSPQTISVCQNSSNNDLVTYLHVNDTDASQTETWTQQVAPLHGTLSISSATATSGSTNITPGGTVTYTPTSGYSGNDTFTIRVSDGTATADMVIYATVNTLPTVTATSDQTNCNGIATNAVTFSGTGSPTYNWSNTNTSIGLAATGSGDIGSFTATNTGAAPVTATVIVTPTASGCTGTTDTFTYTVNQTPTVNAVSNQTNCNGTATTAVTFSGTGSPTFTWSNNTTSIGLAGTGSGDIASFTATNTGTSPVTATVTVTPSANSCAGTPATFTYTVNQTPTVSAVGNQANCHNTATSAVTFSGTGSPSFTWSNNTTSIGLAATGSGNIAGFTATNSTSSPVTATITVTPTANSCTGTPGTFTYTVNPLPTITLGSNPAVCTGLSSANLTYSATTQTPTTYGIVWSGAAHTAGFTDTSAVTLPSSPIVLRIPVAGTPATYTGTLTVTNGNSCSSTGTAFSTTIQSNPSISVNPIDQTICAGASTTTFSVTAAGTGISYQWQVSTNGGSSYNNLTNTGIYTGSTTATLTLTQATVAVNNNMYKVVVTGTCGTPATSTAATLTVTAPPAITSVSPMLAGPAATVTITGTGFNTTASNDIVFFGSTQATVNTASATSLSVSTPNGGTYDRISISNLGCKLMGFSQYSFLPDFVGSSTTPSFGSYTATTGGTNPFDIVTADFDGDGKPDIAMTNGQGGNWTVFRNTSTTGSITYASGTTYTEGPSGQSIYGLAVGDLNRDGKPDIVVADRDSSKIDVYINTSPSAGTISFATRVKYSVTHPWQVKIADLDGDGRPEIIVAGDDQQKFSYFRNIYNGSAAFNSTSFATKVDVSVPSSQFLDALAIGDIDGDGKPDVVVGAQTTNVDNLQVFRNTSSAPGSISFASAVTSSSAQYIYYIAVGDLDGDGKADIVAGNNGASYVTVLPNTSTSGSISFGTAQQLSCNGGGYGVCLADFTGHGKPDIAYVNSDGSTTNVVSIYRNTSTSGNISFASSTDFASLSSQAWGVVGPDMDGDGKPDMVVTNYQGTNFASYLNTMSTTTHPTFTNSSPQTLAVCQNASATSINSLLTVSDAQTGKTDTWTVNTAPTHGTLGGFNATHASGSTSISPTGLTYTPTNGYSGTDQFIVQISDGTTPTTMIVNVTVNAIPTVTATSDQTNCNGTATNAVTFSGTGSPTFSWTNNTASIGLGATGTGNIGSFTATNTGNTPVTATVIVTPTASGCTGTPDTFTYTVNQTPTVSAVSNQTNCNGTATTAVTFSGTGSPTYTWSNNTTSVGLAATGSGNIASFTATNTGTSPTTATITVTPTANSCAGTPTTFTYTVNQTPGITLGSNPSVTEGTSPANLSYSATSGTPTTYSIAWTGIASGVFANVSNASLGSSPIAITVPGTATGGHTYPGTLTVKTASNCTSTSYTVSVTVVSANTAPAFVSSSPQTLTVCQNANATNIKGLLHVNDTDASQTLTWTQQSAPSHGSLVFSSSTATSGSIDIGPGGVITYQPANGYSGSDAFTIRVSDGTASADMVVNVTVNALPTINAVSNQTKCNGTATNAITFSGTGSPTFTWANNTTSIGLAGTGTGDIASFTATNNGTSPVTATVTVTPVANSCAGTPATFTYTVNQTPTISAVSNQTNCNGTATTAVTFSGTGSPTFNWSNNTTSVGLAATGTGSIGSFTAANNGTSPVTATVTVTPVANSCAGTPTTFTYTVNQTPTVNGISNQSACNSTTAAGVSFSGTGSPSFSWSNNTTSIGLAASGTGSIGSFTASNTGSSPVTATVTVTPTANSCNGTPVSFTITVNPSATVTGLSNATVCNNAVQPAISFSGTQSPTFTWSNNTTSIGLGASGTGSIGSFTATNSGTSAVVATVTVTPTSSLNCVGTAQTFTITVNPSATVTGLSNAAVCNNAVQPAISFSGTQSPTFTWSNNTTSIGLGASGTGNIGSFTATNSGSSAVVATITVTPKSSLNCVGTPVPFTITVNSTPTITLGSNPSVCSGVTSASLPYSATTQSPTLYSIVWDAGALSANFVNVTNAAFPASSPISLTIPASAAANTYTGTIYVSNSNGCQSTGYSFSVTVNANPTISLGANPSVCSGVTTTNLSYTATTGSPNQYSIAWSTGALSAGYVNVNLATLSASPIVISNPTNTSAGTFTGKLRVKNSSTGCISDTNAMSITVISSPRVSAFGTNPHVNQGATMAYIAYNAAVNGATTYGVAYDTTAHNAGFTDVTNATLSGGIIPLVLPGGTVYGTFSGTLTFYSTNGCFTSTSLPISVTIGQAPTVTFPSSGTWGETMGAIVTSGTTSTTINYSASGNTPSTYSIVFNSTATAAGFVNVTDATLGASSITISIPANAPIGSYSGALSVKTGTNVSRLYAVIIRIVN